VGDVLRTTRERMVPIARVLTAALLIINSLWSVLILEGGIDLEDPDTDSRWSFNGIFFLCAWPMLIPALAPFAIAYMLTIRWHRAFALLAGLCAWMIPLAGSSSAAQFSPPLALMVIVPPLVLTLAIALSEPRLSDLWHEDDGRAAPITGAKRLWIEDRSVAHARPPRRVSFKEAIIERSVTPRVMAVVSSFIIGAFWILAFGLLFDSMFPLLFSVVWFLIGSCGIIGFDYPRMQFLTGGAAIFTVFLTFGMVMSGMISLILVAVVMPVLTMLMVNRSRDEL
jgi:MFS family permease